VAEDVREWWSSWGESEEEGEGAGDDDAATLSGESAERVTHKVRRVRGIEDTQRRAHAQGAPRARIGTSRARCAGRPEQRQMRRVWRCACVALCSDARWMRRGC
jgi:hypothetical protein